MISAARNEKSAQRGGAGGASNPELHIFGMESKSYEARRWRRRKNGCEKGTMRPLLEFKIQIVVLKYLLS